MNIFKELDKKLEQYPSIGFLGNVLSVIVAIVPPFLVWIVSITVKINISWYIYVIIGLLILNILLVIKIYCKRRINSYKKGTETRIGIGFYNRYDIMEFLRSAQHNIFVVGITNLGLMSPIQKFEDILDKGVDINILLEADDNLLNRMSDFYHGISRADDVVASDKQEISTLLNSFSSLPNYKKYKKNGQIKVRKLPTILSSTYVGIDITREYSKPHSEGIIQTTFYQYNLSTDKCPCIRIDNDINKAIYNNMGQSILDLWNDSEEIEI